MIIGLREREEGQAVGLTVVLVELDIEEFETCNPGGSILLC